MKGQWLGRGEGDENIGTILVDVDEEDEQYFGYAILQPDNPTLPIVFTRFRIPKTLPQKLTVNTFCLDPRNFDVARWEQVEQFFPGVTFSPTADVEFKLVADRLEIDWTTIHGNGKASIPRSRAAKTSELKTTDLKNWHDFKEYVDSLPPHRFAFRGQLSNEWRLRTSFHRTGRANIERYASVDISAVAKHLSAQTSHLFDLKNDLHYGAFMSLIQHHGYPTPLLDWTMSPFVAAFFAYRGVRNIGAPNWRKIRIFQFAVYDWNKIPQNLKLAPVPPHVSVLDAIALGNARVLPQQGISTVTNVDDIETYIQNIEGIRGATYLQAIDLPHTERPKVMNDLAMMGITAGSLLPGLDGACEQLKERYFPM